MDNFEIQIQFYNESLDMDYELSFVQSTSVVHS
jgi:hypothetical protein